MKVLVIGGGGREHALAWKLSESEGVDEVIVAPGNAGTANEAKVRNIPVAADDIHGLLNLAQAEGVVSLFLDLTTGGRREDCNHIGRANHGRLVGRAFCYVEFAQSPERSLIRLACEMWYDQTLS